MWQKNYLTQLVSRSCRETCSKQLVMEMYTMSTAINQYHQGPKDLIWDLMHIKSPDRAFQFMDAFKTGLCVFSSAVQKVYTNYSVHMPNAANLEDKKLVILPQFQAFHDIVNNIPEEAIESTNCKIIPGQAINKKGVFLTGKMRGCSSASVLPLKTAIKAIRLGAYAEGKFLPLLAYGDLKEMPKKNIPYLMLHKINMDKLTHLASFETEMIERTVLRNLENLQFLSNKDF